MSDFELERIITKILLELQDRNCLKLNEIVTIESMAQTGREMFRKREYLVEENEAIKTIIELLNKYFPDKFKQLMKDLQEGKKSTEV